MTGFLVGNAFGTFESKKAETVQAKVFAAEANGYGLTDIAQGDSLKTIWSSAIKSAAIFKSPSVKALLAGKAGGSSTVVYQGNEGKSISACFPGMPGSADKALQNYSGISTTKISLYDDAGPGAGKSNYAKSGEPLIGAARIVPKAGVKMTWDIVVVNCNTLMTSKMKNGAGIDIQTTYPWGTQEANAVGSSYANPSWNTGTNRAVRLTLDGDKGDYIEIDMDGGAMSNKNFSTQVDGVYYGTSTQPDNYCGNSVRIDLNFRGVAALPKVGCMDTVADNYSSDYNKKCSNCCTYTTATISSFTTNKPTLKVGETATLSWSISNGNFDEVQIIHDGSNIMEDDADWDDKKISQSQSIEVSPSTTGNKGYELKVLWNKSNAATRTDDITLNVQSAISYVPCPDPNRPTDNNGECAAGCNSGFYMDSTTGLCTQCGMDDPAQSENRNVGTDGLCGDCESGYALDSDDHCVKSGCMDEDDYEYDPDAVIDDPSACEGFTGETDIDCELSDWSDWSEWSDPDTESGTRTRTRTVVTAASGNGAVCESIEEIETGVLDPETGEVIITTMSVTDPPPADDEPGFPVVPVVIGTVVLGVLFMMMRR